jgi:transcriptional regulator with XRE-family HTH domain
VGNTYGEWLKTRREASGLTQQQLADAAIMTRSHIAHIEGGRRVPSPDDARRLDRALGTGDVLSSFRPGDDSAVADHFATARELERQATCIREYASVIMPGILQTEKYARAIMSTAFPPWSSEERDRLVVARLERAEALDGTESPVLWVLLDEAVLRRPVGGADTMAEQINHVVGLAESGRARVHVLPFGLGAHSLMASMLSLMWFDDQPPVAYTEGTRVGKVIDSPGEVQQLQDSYALALSDAMPLRESVAFLKEIAEEYGIHG